MSKFALHDGTPVPESDVTSFPDGLFQQTSSGMPVTKLITEFGLARPETPEQIAGHGGGAPVDLAPLAAGIMRVEIAIRRLRADLGLGV